MLFFQMVSLRPSGSSITVFFLAMITFYLFSVSNLGIVAPDPRNHVEVISRKKLVDEKNVLFLRKETELCSAGTTYKYWEAKDVYIWAAKFKNTLTELCFAGKRHFSRKNSFHGKSRFGRKSRSSEIDLEVGRQKSTSTDRPRPTANASWIWWFERIG